MKKLLLILTAILLIGALILGGCTKTETPTTTTTTTTTAPATTAAPEPIKLIFATPNPALDGSTLIANNYLDYVEKNCGGKIKFERFPGGTLGRSTEMLGLLKSGSVDIGIMQPIRFGAELPLNTMQFHQRISMQDGLVNVDKLNFTNQETASLFENEQASQNIKFLTQFPLSEEAIVSRTPFSTMSDLKNLKTGAAYSNPMAEKLGMKVVIVPFEDTYESISRGVIDAMLQLVMAIEGLKWYEPCKTIASFEQVTYGLPMTINLDTWNRLPADVQKVFLDARAATEADSLKLAKDNLANSLDKFKAAGLTVATFDKADLDNAYNTWYDINLGLWMATCEKAGVSDKATIIKKYWDGLVWGGSK